MESEIGYWELLLIESLGTLANALNSFASSDALQNVASCSELATCTELQGKYRDALCHEMIVYGKDIYPATTTFVEKFGNVIATDILSIETPEGFLSNLDRLVKDCDRLKFQANTLRLKSTTTLSHLIDLRDQIKMEAGELGARIQDAKADAKTKESWSRWSKGIGMGAVAVGSLPVVLTGTTLYAIGRMLKSDASEIEKKAVGLGLAHEELNGMVTSTNELYDVIENIEKFLATIKHLSQLMARTGMSTRSIDRAKVTLSRFQSEGSKALEACDQFCDMQRKVELAMLSLGRKYGVEEAMIKQWEKELEDGIRGLLTE